MSPRKRDDLNEAEKRRRRRKADAEGDNEDGGGGRRIGMVVHDGKY